MTAPVVVVAPTAPDAETASVVVAGASVVDSDPTPEPALEPASVSAVDSATAASAGSTGAVLQTTAFDALAGVVVMPWWVFVALAVLSMAVLVVLVVLLTRRTAETVDEGPLTTTDDAADESGADDAESTDEAYVVSAGAPSPTVSIPLADGGETVVGPAEESTHALDSTAPLDAASPLDPAHERLADGDTGVAVFLAYDAVRDAVESHGGPLGGDYDSLAPAWAAATGRDADAAEIRTVVAGYEYARFGSTAPAPADARRTLDAASEALDALEAFAPRGGDAR